MSLDYDYMSAYELAAVLLMPTMPSTAFDVGLDVPAGSGMKWWFEWSPNTYLFNATGQSACSILVGLASNGLPSDFKSSAASERI